MVGSTGFQRSPTQNGGAEAWSDWTNPSIIQSWIAWREKASKQQEELTRLLLERTGLYLGAHALDLASGTGEPALTIAERVGSSGRVVAGDIAPEFVATIISDALARGLSNVTAIQFDACNLPFPNETFDVVTCRLGAMYFNPLETALGEIHRVLTLGGRVALMTWGMPEAGTFYSDCVFPFLQRSRIEPPGPNEPSWFRFSPPGSLASGLVHAGFHDVAEERVEARMAWPGPPEEAWRHVYETSGSLRHVFDALDDKAFDEAYSEAMRALVEHWDGEYTTTTVEVVIGSGSR